MGDANLAAERRKVRPSGPSAVAVAAGYRPRHRTHRPDTKSAGKRFAKEKDNWASDDRAGSKLRRRPLTSACSRRYLQTLTLRPEHCCCRKVATLYHAAAPAEASISAHTSAMLLRLGTTGPHALRSVGVLARRAGPLDCAAARTCREAGARIATNASLRDLILDQPAADGRRIEVVANNLWIWQGAQTVVDITIVSPLRHDGEPHPQRIANPNSPSVRPSTASCECTQN